MRSDTAKPKTWSVTEITQALKKSIESAFPEVRVSGEISRFTRSTVNHIYFTLKDETAVLPAVIYSFNMKGMDIPATFGLKSLEDFSNASILEKSVHGRKVTVTGQLSAYSRSGSYQIVVKTIELEGAGDLQRRFEELKERLRKKGWFDPAAKKPLPRFPRRIGVVTSPTGAVIRDILNVTKRRWDSTDILLYPALVQGDRAAEDIARGIRTFNRHACADVLIVGRGGGSLEDLWAFNEETVAEAIHSSRIPIVSAVGHETDFTIADFVADLRAPTPSAAAELILTPTKADVQQKVRDLAAKMSRRLQERTAFHRQVLDRITPDRLKKDLLQTVASCRDLLRRRCSVEKMARDLGNIARFQETTLERLSDSLAKALRKSLDALNERSRRAAAKLNLLNPLGILERGYSVTRLEGPDGRIVRSPEDAPTGTRIVSILSGGRILSVTEEETQK